jgi:NTP pyrophosphatase (non-canonical NTP hydrolase)
MNGHDTLSAAETERIAMLIEECGEVIQAASKVLRHGYLNHHPDRTKTNKDDLHAEMVDLIAVHEAMFESGDLPNYGHRDLQKAWQKKLRYAHHQ